MMQDNSMDHSTKASKRYTKRNSNQDETNGNSAVPDFIQKLFRMLDNKAFQDVFCWNPSGTTFLVKDTNEFSKTILPKHFKHCNFASFVRQLNKYDFHKIRSNADESQRIYGDQIWEFEHLYFKRDRRDLLEEIKRKTPGKKKKTPDSNNNNIKLEPQDTPHDGLYNTPSPTIGNDESKSNASVFQQFSKLTKSLQSQVDLLRQSQSELETTIDNMNQKEKMIMTELSGLQESLRTKDRLLKECFQLAQSSALDQNSGNSSDLNNSNQAQDMCLVPTSTVASQSQQWAEQQPLEDLLTNIFLPTQPPQASIDTASVAAAAAQLNGSSLIGSSIKTSDGLTFLALGRLSSNNKNEPYSPQTATASSSSPPQQQQRQQQRQQHQQQQHVPATEQGTTDKGKRKMLASWTTPPRVLLVDDDSVYRDVSGRMLNMIGCSIDVAKDGLEALQKMSVEKYDLILMDIIMPKMDGIATTRNIRRYDSLTPIVSMTSNFTHKDIIEYIDIGMNDILPKPFSKNTLYDILEKHCAHLKIIQQQQQLQHGQQTEELMIPRGIIPSIAPIMEDANSNSNYTTNTPTSTTSTTSTASTSASSLPAIHTLHSNHNDSGYWQPVNNNNQQFHSTQSNKRQKLQSLYDNSTPSRY